VKLDSSLPDRGAGFLYTAPLLDVVLLLLIFFLFGSNFVLKSGVSIRLPTTRSALPAAPQAHIITVTAGNPELIFFNERRVEREDLDEVLKASHQRSSQVILLGDESVHYGTIVAISDLVLQHGYDLSFATAEERP